jgi:VWFA-related protein
MTRGPLGFSVLLVLCAAAVLQAVGQAPTFSAKVEAVRVDVLVTDGGQPVRGLHPQDFEILDDGVAQQVDLASFEQVALNVILVLDVSESVEGERLGHLRDASRELLAGLLSADQSALITFNHTVRLAAALASDAGPMRTAIDAISAGGGTALHDAAFSSMVLCDSVPGRGLVILFTDGSDTASYFTRENVLETARRSDAVVYGASAGRGRKALLHDITKQTGGRLLQVESTKDLAKTFRSILDEFRQRYLLSYSPRGVARGGWHELTVRLKGGRRGTVKARPGYLADKPTAR